MELASLPDDEMLQVLCYLTSKELLQSRAVCRRWRSLALHPSIWCKQRIFYSDPSSPVCCAVLRLAPRLGFLKNNDDFPNKCGALFLTTRCAISAVKLSFDAKDAVIYTAFLMRQAALGRLKKVSVRVSGGKTKSEKLRIRTLLHQLVHTHGLEEIRISGPGLGIWPQLARAAELESPVPASLRKLSYARNSDDPYLHLYLKWHAASLEVVKLGNDQPNVMPLLCALPRLQKLRCTMMEDMPSLLDCETLKTVHLVVNLGSKTRSSLPSVESFLSGAVSRLEELVLDFEDGEERADVINLVLCLKGSGKTPASLRRLTFFPSDGTELHWSDTEPPLQLRPLTFVLDRLPHLTHLNIGGAPSDEFLRALDGHVLTELVELKVNSPLECFHEWAHSEDVDAVMRRYPKLHIVIMYDVLEDAVCTANVCTFCNSHACHSNIRGELVIFSHAVSAQCSVDHSQYPLRTQFHID